MPDNKVKDKQLYCEECESTDLLYTENEVICKHCGLVLGINENQYVVQEQKQSERSKVNVKSHQPVTGKEVRTTFTVTSKNPKFFILKKKNDVHSHKEKAIINADIMIKRCSNELSLPEHVLEASQRIYLASAKKGILKKTSIEGLVAASLHTACRFHEMGIAYEDILKTANYSDAKNEVSGVVREIVKQVFPELEMKFKPPNFDKMFFRLSNQLKESLDGNFEDYLYIERYSHRLFKSYNAKISANEKSKDPKGQIAACLYIGAILCKNKISQAAVAKVAKVSDMTIRTRMKDVIKVLNVGYIDNVNENQMRKNIEGILKQGKKSEDELIEELVFGLWCPRNTVKSTLSKIIEDNDNIEVKSIDNNIYYSVK